VGSGAERLPTPDPGAARFRLVLATDLSLVGDAVEAVVGCCESTAPLTARDRFRLCTVTAEALANAMLYGNREEPHRQVILELELVGRQIIVAVVDEGQGFDPGAVVELVDESECHAATRGRGLFMIRHLAEQVRFNPEGNAIWVTLTRA
jgi:anti-sigma regulatory factor (Ser/Thr protein kinase)